MRGIEYGGTAVEKKDLQDAITGEMVYILAISLCLVVAILLITSESWLELFILLAASGVAVLLNRGTNVMFGEISYITNSIAVILQLALSIDYSIVLLHAYRRQKETTTDTGAAMKAAILSVIKPVSVSALTTIAGLLAFLFMSFRIGFDIGIVLMKGIVISAITSLTLLPALVLLLDTPIRKAKKKAFVPPRVRRFAKPLIRRVSSSCRWRWRWWCCAVCCRPGTATFLPIPRWAIKPSWTHSAKTMPWWRCIKIRTIPMPMSSSWHRR